MGLEDDAREFDSLTAGLEPETEPVVIKTPYSAETMARLGRRGLVMSAVTSDDSGQVVNIMEVIPDMPVARFLVAQEADTTLTSGERSVAMFRFLIDVHSLDDDSFGARWPELL